MGYLDNITKLVGQIEMKHVANSEWWEGMLMGVLMFDYSWYYGPLGLIHVTYS